MFLVFIEINYYTQNSKLVVPYLEVITALYIYKNYDIMHVHMYYAM